MKDLSKKVLVWFVLASLEANLLAEIYIYMYYEAMSYYILYKLIKCIFCSEICSASGREITLSLVQI